MLNYEALNEHQIGYSPIPSTVLQDDIAFDGYGLQNSVIKTSVMDSDDLGQIDLTTFEFPRDDGGWVLSKYYRGRQIHLRVTINAATQSDLNDTLDDMKRNLRKTEGNLDIAINWEIRRIRATMTGMKFDRKHYHITFAQADITFTAVDPFFRAVSDQSWLFEGRATDFWEEISNDGSTDTDPRFYYIFGAGTSATQLALTCRTRTITITRSFSPWDILLIDSDEKTVTYNGADVDYSGMFPIFSPGSNPFHTIIAGSALVDLTAIAAKNYF